MYRREWMVAVGLALTGCTTAEEPATPTPTSTSTPTPTSTPTAARTPTRTQAVDLGTIEYTVTNAADEAYRLDVAMANAEGRVVQETTEPALAPGGTVSSGSAGEPPEMGPYTLTFRTETAEEAYVWDVRECPRIHLQVTIETGGTLAIERDLCQS